MSNYIYSDLEKEFLKHAEYKSTEGTLLKSTIISKIKELDEKTISIILGFKELKTKFTKEINGITVLDKQNLLSFFQSREFIPNSFTEYTNKIGLTNGLKFLDHSDEVVLDFPYKDCILLGNQSKEENEGVRQKFFHEVINFQEIDRLFTKKVLCDFKKHTRNGIVNVSEFKETDNLIIKGNNLIALHTIKEKFAGKVKLIYIDPPYNTESLKFAYNDKFDQATWLTFMKNRLEVAKDLLRDDGVIVVQLDKNQDAYLKVLMDSIFGENFFINSITIQSSTPSGTKTTHKDKTIIKTKDTILVYKNGNSTTIEPQYTEKTKWDTHYDSYIDFNNNSIQSLKEVLIANNIINTGKEVNEDLIKNKKFYEFCLKHKNNIFRKSPTMPLDIKQKSKNSPKEIIEYEDENGNKQFAIGGNRMNFLSTSVKLVDNQLKMSNLLCDIWTDIDFNNTQNEGGVSLPSGKKPEKLLFRILSMFSQEGDIVLDYHLGSGTTCAVAQKMGRQYIGIEQLDYGQNDSIIRLNNVLSGEQGGMSSALNWKGGGEFISMKLYSIVDEVLNKIQQAKTQSEIDVIIDLLLSEKYFYYLGINENKTPYEEIFVSDEFKKLSIDEQKRILHSSIDKNNLYVDFNDLHDNIVNIPQNEKELNEKFYKGKK